MKSGLSIKLRQAAKHLLTFIGLRTKVNPYDPADIKRLNESEETIIFSQMGPGRMDIPLRDKENLLKVSRDK